MSEELQTYSFGEWIKRRRNELRLTQREVAAAAFCSVAMIKKIESDQRQPSPELAQGLAEALQIPFEQQALFVQSARGERPLDHFTRHLPGETPAPAGLPSLPSPGTLFIGRKAELAEVVAKMQDPTCRLLTLIGPGGIGKTRLAIEAARALQEHFEGGALFVSLATVEDHQSLPGAIAETMQVPLTGSDAPQAQLARLLQKRELLLVLDNLEQLISGAGMLSDLLSAAPQLKLLVTSRERLNLAQEWLFTLPELDEATALFAQTVRRLQPGFDLEEEAPAVRQICELVSGHPLAIELAASWTRFMPLAQIAAQIEEDFDFLSSGPRNAPQRHQSLRALFDHSWQLLSQEEQEALAKFSVFRGGFAAEEAKFVAGAGWPFLKGLVDKSLVEMSAEWRFDLHGLTRQYTGEKLEKMGLESVTREIHFETFRQLAAQFMQKQIGHESATMMHRLEKEHENIRGALAWGLENGREALLLKFMQDLFRFWLRAGYWREGEDWFRKAVSQTDPGDSADLAIGLNMLGVFNALQGRLPEAKPLTDEAMQMARRVEDPWALVLTLQTQGQANPNMKMAIAAFEEAAAVCREHHGQQRFDVIYASILRLHGNRLRDNGRLLEAKIKFEESLAQLRAIGDDNEIFYPLGDLGRLALQEGDLKKAHALITESVASARRFSRVGIADWLFRLGQVHYYLDQLEEALRNFQEALTLYEDIDNRFGPPSILSNLALAAIDLGQEDQAVQFMNESLHRYAQLEQAAQFTDQSASYFVFSDSIDSLLQAGLVAHALGEWRKGLLFFSYVEENRPRYQTIKPLHDQVIIATQALKARHSAEDVQAVVNEARQISLMDLLKSF